MIPARWPREEPLRERMLHVDPRSGTLRDARVSDLPSILRPGDVLVVNDAATLPGSLQGSGPAGAPIEIRLATALPDESFRAFCALISHSRSSSSSASRHPDLSNRRCKFCRSLASHAEPSFHQDPAEQ